MPAGERFESLHLVKICLDNGEYLNPALKKRHTGFRMCAANPTTTETASYLIRDWLSSDFVCASPARVPK